MSSVYSIDGNIGSGKSTLVKKLQKYLNVNYKKIVFLQEPVNEWEDIVDKNNKNILQYFYEDKKKYSFSFQMMAYISRIHQLREAICLNPTSIIISERSVETDKNVFAKMLYDDEFIDEIDYKIYLKWFDEFNKNIPFVGIIYVKTLPLTSYTRVKKRSRKGEVIPIEYLQKCSEYHDNWIYSSKYKTLILDGNKEFETNPNILKEWCFKINTFIAENTILYKDFNHQRDIIINCLGR